MINNLSRIILLVFTTFVLFTYCSQPDQDIVLASFDNGSINEKEYIDHFLLSAQYKPDKFPTEENLREIVLLKANEKMALQEALAEGIESDTAYLNVVTNNERRLLYQKICSFKYH